jgi:hypothetical protein
MDISFKDDVTVILLLDVSFIVEMERDMLERIHEV